MRGGGWLRRLAARAPVPVLALPGEGTRERVQDLQLRDELSLVDTPRSANVLLIAGRLPTPLLTAAVRLCDSMPRPRGVVWWRLGADDDAVRAAFADVVVADTDDPVPPMAELHCRLLGGDRPSTPPLLPDRDPAPWRGVGPYGQGGSGMTGGVPYGRPMAGRGDDRDGLSLDRLPVRVGPFFAAFPTGLVLDLELHGDVVQEVKVAENPFASGGGVAVPTTLGPFLEALVRPVPVAQLELARARSHLRALARGLAVHGLGALSRRSLRLASTVRPGEVDAVHALGRFVAASQLLGWSTSGVGVAGAERLAGLGAGPVGRAAGLADDARLGEPAYRALGFEPVLGDGGSAADRWRQRLAELHQSLDLAARAGDATAGGAGVVEGPRGRLEVGSGPANRLLAILPGLLAGLEWGDAVTTIASLDLDLVEAASAGAIETWAVVR